MVFAEDALNKLYFTDWISKINLSEITFAAVLKLYFETQATFREQYPGQRLTFHCQVNDKRTGLVEQMTSLDYTAFPVDIKVRVLTHFRDEVCRKLPMPFAPFYDRRLSVRLKPVR